VYGKEPPKTGPLRYLREQRWVGPAVLLILLGGFALTATGRGGHPLFWAGVLLCAAGVITAVVGWFLLVVSDVDPLRGTATRFVATPLLVLGAGIGLAMPSAFSLATLGVRMRDQGVASATANTSQQIGGAIGTAAFNTIAADDKGNAYYGDVGATPAVSPSSTRVPNPPRTASPAVARTQ